MKRLFQCLAVLMTAVLMQCGGSSSSSAPGYPALSGENKTIADTVNKAVQGAVKDALSSIPASVTRAEPDSINYSKDGVTVTGSSESMKVEFKDHTKTSDGHTLVINGTMNITRSEAEEAVMSEIGKGELSLTFDGTSHTMEQSYTRLDNYKTKKFTKTGTITFDGTVFSANDSGDLDIEPGLPELSEENLAISNDFIQIFGNVLMNSVPAEPGVVDIEEDTMTVKGTVTADRIDLNVTLSGYQAMASHLDDQANQTIFQVLASGNCTFSSEKQSDTKNYETNSITVSLAKYSEMNTGAAAGEYKNFVIETTNLIDSEAGTKTKTLSVTIDGVKYAKKTMIEQ